MEPTALPPTCGIAFKEWSGVCSALASGRQSLILRKGGIAEESGAFRPEHPVFWLFPTHLHEQQQGLREPVPELPAGEGVVTLPALVVVSRVEWLDDPARLEALVDLHIWSDETISKRFVYRRPGLWVLGAAGLSARGALETVREPALRWVQIVGRAGSGSLHRGTRAGPRRGRARSQNGGIEPGPGAVRSASEGRRPDARWMTTPGRPRRNWNPRSTPRRSRCVCSGRPSTWRCAGIRARSMRAAAASFRAGSGSPRPIASGR